jgi:hypothetical protein
MDILEIEEKEKLSREAAAERPARDCGLAGAA